MSFPLSELIQNHNVRPRGVVHMGLEKEQWLECYTQHCVPRLMWVEDSGALASFFQASPAPLVSYNFLTVEASPGKLLDRPNNASILTHFDYVYLELMEEEAGDFLNQQGFTQAKLKRNPKENPENAFYVRKKFL